MRWGKASPSRHQNSQPMSPWTYSASSSSASSTTRVASMTSTPIPSPGSHAMRYLLMRIRPPRRTNCRYRTSMPDMSRKPASDSRCRNAQFAQFVLPSSIRIPRRPFTAEVLARDGQGRDDDLRGGGPSPFPGRVRRGYAPDHASQDPASPGGPRGRDRPPRARRSPRRRREARLQRHVDVRAEAQRRPAGEDRAVGRPGRDLGRHQEGLAARVDPVLAHGRHREARRRDPHDRADADRVPLRHRRRRAPLLLQPREHAPGRRWQCCARRP